MEIFIFTAMANTMRVVNKIGAYLLLIIVVNTGYLFTQKLRTDDPKWSYMFEINNHARFFITMDALGYVNASMHPSILITQNEIRQSRPLYAVQNTIIGDALMLLLSPVYPYLERSTVMNNLGHRIIDLNNVVVERLGARLAYLPNVKTPDFNAFDIAVRIPVFYFAYIISNLLILLMSLLLFEQIWIKLTDVPVRSLLYLLTCIFLMTSFVEKDFFWTAHQQMCTILGPLFCVWICLSVFDRSLDKVGRLYTLSFIGGTLMLYYGNFLMILPCIILPYIWIHWRDRTLVSLALFSIICAILFAIPNLAWVYYLKAIGITYYNHEVTSFKEIVWMLDLLQLTPLAAFKKMVGFFILYVFSMKVLLPICIWLAVVIALFAGTRIREIVRQESFALVLFCFALYFAFYYFVGIYVLRLSFTVSIALICLTPLFIKNSVITKNKVWILAGITCAWYLYNVFSYGTYM